MRRNLLFLLLTILASANLREGQAADPIYSLDQLTQHPYRFVPAYGHASQNPGSPKWFRPGYGYQIPGSGYSLSSAVTYYHEQIPTPPAAFGPGETYWTVGRAPWYLPGAPESSARLKPAYGW